MRRAHWIAPTDADGHVEEFGAKLRSSNPGGGRGGKGGAGRDGDSGVVVEVVNRSSLQLVDA